MALLARFLRFPLSLARFASFFLFLKTIHLLLLCARVPSACLVSHLAPTIILHTAITALEQTSHHLLDLSHKFPIRHPPRPLPLMAQQPPLRRRDRNSRLDDDYYYHPSPTRGDGINGGDPYGPPPRRHKSERRGRPVPDFGPDDAFSPPRRSRRNRSPDPYEFKKPAAGGGGGSRRPRSPPPYYASEPERPRRESRRERPPPPFERDAAAFPPDPRAERDRPSRRRRDGPVSPPRGRRGRESPPPYMDSRHRGAPRDGPPPAMYGAGAGAAAGAAAGAGAGGRHGSPDARPRRRHISPEPRPRGRDAHPPRGYSPDHDPRRRPRSQAKPTARGAPSPPPLATRGRTATAAPAGGAAAAAGAVPKPARRNSMPASFMKKGAALWANPLIQAGARTAFTAGAQAAMKSRNDPSPWLGAKGAKVATAALGAALVDGFMGQKHPGSARQGMMRSGVEAVLGEAERRSSGDKHHSSSGDKHRSSGRSSRRRD